MKESNDPQVLDHILGNSKDKKKKHNQIDLRLINCFFCKMVAGFSFRVKNMQENLIPKVGGQNVVKYCY